MKKIAALIQSTTFATLIAGFCFALPASARPAGMGAAAAAQAEPESCKNVVGKTLEATLGIDFGNVEVDDSHGDVITLACKAHPARPGLTIAAMFYRLKDARGEEEKDKSGFAVALIDPQRKIVHSLYRTVLEDEATMRSSGGLSIDTARYQLKPGVRAFGVRMSIGWGPRCADGGWDNFLTLFVEEGKQLTPVLEMLPMDTWAFSKGENTCDPETQDGAFETTAWSLALSNSTTAGWRDLDVVARTTVDAPPAPDGTTVQGKPRVVYKLRKKGKLYSKD
jgi:hypothetical protein